MSWHFSQALEAMGELYAMAIEHCKYRGWSKHPTIDKAHALLWPNIPVSNAGANTKT